MVSNISVSSGIIKCQKPTSKKRSHELFMFFPSNIDFFSFHLAGGGWSSTSNGWSFIARGGCSAPDFFKATKWRSNLLVAVERLAISFLNVRLASNVQQAFSIHALVLLVLHEVESCRTLWRSNQPTLCFFCEGEAVVTEVDCELLWPSLYLCCLMFELPVRPNIVNA